MKEGATRHPPSAVLFWDIDGTLLTTFRAGIAAWEGSIEALTGRKISLEDYPTAGLTDVEIALLLANEAGDSSASTVLRLLGGYEDRLPGCLPLRTGSTMPGVIEVLDRLRSMPWIHSTLLTGNTRRGAAAKLEHYRLDRYFADGTFSDHLPDRPSIARCAVEMVEQRFGFLPRERMFVIGDTPHDIHCGKAVGVRTVAVCTGDHDHAALAAHDPWLILESLADVDQFFAALDLIQQQ
jgi:phosphoglycolate phosphatase-like HAD superfamily hydrolase